MTTRLWWDDDEALVKWRRGSREMTTKPRWGDFLVFLTAFAKRRTSAIPAHHAYGACAWFVSIHAVNWRFRIPESATKSVICHNYPSIFGRDGDFFRRLFLRKIEEKHRNQRLDMHFEAFQRRKWTHYLPQKRHCFKGAVGLVMSYVIDILLFRRNNAITMCFSFSCFSQNLKGY